MSLIAQNPGNHSDLPSGDSSSTRAPSKIYDGYFNGENEAPWDVFDSELCISPIVIDFSVVRLTDGSFTVELIFDESASIPQQVNTVGGKFSEYFTNTDPNIFIWSGDGIEVDGEQILSISYQDPCSEEMVTLTIPLDCDPSGFISGISSQFMDDLAVWNDGGRVDPIWNFLNSLEYLTYHQRWEFYQRSIVNCERIHPLVVFGLIPPEYYKEPTECDCDFVQLAQDFSHGDYTNPAQNAHYNIDPGLDGRRIELSGGVNRVYFWNHILEGATKHHAMRLTDIAGNGNVIIRRRGTASDPDVGARFTQYRALLRCGLGGGFDEDQCFCEKKVNIEYAYHGEVYTQAELRKSLAGKSSGANATDFGMATLEYMGETELLDFSARAIGAACEMEVNDEFVSQVASLATTISSGFSVNDSTGVEFNGLSIIPDVIGDVAGLFTTPAAIFTPCDGITRSHSFNGRLSKTIQPNEMLTFTLSSGEELSVQGNRSYDSRAHASSAHRIAVNIPSRINVSDTPDWCCSKNGGSYVATSQVSDIEELNLRNLVATTLRGWGFSGTAGSSLSDYGLLVTESADSDCANVEVQSLVLSPDILRSFNVYDFSGRLLISLSDYNDSQPVQLPDGIYIVQGLSLGSGVPFSEKVAIFNGVITNLNHE